MRDSRQKRRQSQGPRTPQHVRFDSDDDDTDFALDGAPTGKGASTAPLQASGNYAAHGRSSADDSKGITQKQPAPLKRKTQTEAHGPLQKAKSGRPHKPREIPPELTQARKELPIFKARDEILRAVEENASIVLVGETGSGKTTQVPQYLLESGKFETRHTARDGQGQRHRPMMIACTQPRRVAAVTVAQRVAAETGSTVGGLVGYAIRFDEKWSDYTRIKYMTDGMLLREAMSDPLLSRYSVVVLDEAHERTVNTDILFAIVKAAQQQRPRLKIVAMSATLEAEAFASYFNNAKMLHIKGRTFPVQLMYTEEPQQDYLDSVVVTVLQVHRDAPLPGDILVFLTGQDEIEALQKLLVDCSRSRPEGVPPLVVCPMYGALPPHEQLKAFQPAPEGCRKVILATNIAETSITINGIKHVVDPGLVKQRVFNPRNGMDSLVVLPISQAQARQRCGRAGRESSGTCYRLYTEDTFEELSPSTVPEIVRCNLSNVVLQLLAIGVKDVLNFDYMTPPSTDALTAALELLYDLEAVDDSGELTETGRKMSLFPLDPKLSKTLLASKSHRCSEEVVTVAALLSVESIFFNPPGALEKAGKARKKFNSPEGDHSTLLNVYYGFKGMKGDRQWCHDNFVNIKSMNVALDTRKQLVNICQRMDIEMVSAGDNTTLYRKCFLAGFFANVGTLQPDGTYKVVKTNQQVAIHPSSACFGARPRPSCLLFNELVQTNKKYMRNACVLDPDWLPEVVPQFFRATHTLQQHQ